MSELENKVPLCLNNPLDIKNQSQSAAFSEVIIKDKLRKVNLKSHDFQYSDNRNIECNEYLPSKNDQVNDKKWDQFENNVIKSKMNNKTVHRRKQILKNIAGFDDYVFETLESNVAVSEEKQNDETSKENTLVNKKKKMDKSFITKIDKLFRQKSMGSTLEHDLNDVLSTEETRSVLIRDELLDYFSDLDLIGSDMPSFISYKKSTDVNIKKNSEQDTQSDSSETDSFYNLDYIVQL